MPHVPASGSASVKLVRRCTSMYNIPVAVMTVSEARAALPDVLNRVADGEEITITRHGKPVAVIVHPGALRSRSRADGLVAEAERLNEMLRAAAGGPRSPGGISLEYAEELVAAIRAERDAD
jgi:prevent-host-death family protein